MLGEGIKVIKKRESSLTFLLSVVGNVLCRLVQRAKEFGTLEGVLQNHPWPLL